MLVLVLVACIPPRVVPTGESALPEDTGCPLPAESPAAEPLTTNCDTAPAGLLGVPSVVEMDPSYTYVFNVVGCAEDFAIECGEDVELEVTPSRINGDGNLTFWADDDFHKPVTCTLVGQPAPYASFTIVVQVREGG